MRKTATLVILALAALSSSPAAHADTTTENTNFIKKAYADLLQRSPPPADVALGLTALGSESRYDFALSLDTSTPYYQLLVNSYFQGLLGRPALGDLSLFVPLLQSSSTDESVQALIAGSPEFFSHNGGTEASFVTALYHDFLQRSPTPVESSSWGLALSSMSFTREQVAAMILGSSEYDTDLVESYYLRFLQTSADSAGLAFFASALHGGTLTDEQVIASLIGSDAYFTLAQTSSQAQTPEPRTIVLLALGLAA